MKMGVFTEGMAKLMETSLRRKLEDQYDVLMESYQEWGEKAAYWDWITPQTGLGRNCDGNLPDLPFTIPDDLPFTIPDELPQLPITLPPGLPFP